MNKPWLRESGISFRDDALEGYGVEIIFWGFKGEVKKKNETPHVKHHSIVYQYKEMSYLQTLVDFDALTYNVRGLGDERKRRKS